METNQSRLERALIGARDKPQATPPRVEQNTRADLVNLARITVDGRKKVMVPKIEIKGLSRS